MNAWSAARTQYPLPRCVTLLSVRSPEGAPLDPVAIERIYSAIRIDPDDPLATRCEVKNGDDKKVSTGRLYFEERS